MTRRKHKKKADLNSTMGMMTEKIYASIQEYTASEGIPPSIAEIAERVHLSRGGVMRHLDKLELQGRLRRDFNKRRSIVLIEKKIEEKIGE